MIGVDRDDRLGRVLARALRVAGTHVERDHLDRSRPRLAELGKEPVGRGRVVAARAQLAVVQSGTCPEYLSFDISTVVDLRDPINEPSK